MKSGLDAAAFLASFSFNRSAAQPRAITLTCIFGTLTCHCRLTLWAALCMMSREGWHAYQTSDVWSRCVARTSLEHHLVRLT